MRATSGVLAGAGLAAAATTAVLFYQPRWLLARLGTVPDVTYFVETDEPLVALTIDDGPDPATTPRIARVLAAHGARATFFLIGRRIAGRDDVVRRLVRGGHELGNHLMRDDPSIRLSPARFAEALAAADAILSRFATVRWARPAGGWYDRTMLDIIGGHGLNCAMGSVYPYDAAIPSVSFAAFHILHTVRPGSVIVLHDGGRRGRRTAAVLTRVLPRLRERGLRVVTLSRLVAARRRTPSHRTPAVERAEASGRGADHLTR